jgi:two-component system response regulator FixJ
MPEGSLIYIVDDDHDLCESTSLMLEGHGYRCAVYSSAAEFLASNPKSSDGCLLLDIRMPGIDGLTLQTELAKRGVALPIIFMTGFGDVVHAVRAMKAGAVDFIEKPCPPHAFLEAIDRALSRGRRDRMAADETRAAQRRMARLSPREHDVMKGLVAGSPNKVIARKLGISTRTVEIHRSRIMDKMEAKSLAELVRIALAASSEQSV